MRGEGQIPVRGVSELAGACRCSGLASSVASAGATSHARRVEGGTGSADRPVTRRGTQASEDASSQSAPRLRRAASSAAERHAVDSALQSDAQPRLTGLPLAVCPLRACGGGCPGGASRRRTIPLSSTRLERQPVLRGAVQDAQVLPGLPRPVRGHRDRTSVVHVVLRLVEPRSPARRHRAFHTGRRSSPPTSRTRSHPTARDRRRARVSPPNGSFEGVRRHRPFRPKSGSTVPRMQP